VRRGEATCSTGRGSGLRVAQASGRDQTLGAVPQRRLSGTIRTLASARAQQAESAPVLVRLVLLDKLLSSSVRELSLLCGFRRRRGPRSWVCQFTKIW
jgi:hypothetical protein